MLLILMKIYEKYIKISSINVIITLYYDNFYYILNHLNYLIFSIKYLKFNLYF
jgi:DNA integrity scanning protein DisA with diadenylate cyclase activity